MDNALKHSAGNIQVSVKQAGAQLKMRGDDTSIPGFGLSIAKTLVKAQGKGIKMESTLGKSSALILLFHSPA